jgi:hypothetical protein
MEAPDASVTLPEMEDVVTWPLAGDGNEKTARHTVNMGSSQTRD